MAVTMAPTVDSYKRTGATSTSSGATWSPRVATYGGNDRTHYVRVPDGNRVEFSFDQGVYATARAVWGDGGDERGD